MKLKFSKEEMDSLARNSIRIFHDPDGRGGIYNFDNGWSAAKKSPIHFLLWLGLLPFISFFYIIRLFSKKSLSGKATQIYPPVHGKSDELYDVAYEEIIRIRKRSPKSKKAFDEYLALRSEKFPKEETLDPLYFSKYEREKFISAMKYRRTRRK